MVDHPSQETLRRFLLARLSDEEESGVGEHVRGGGAPCERCLFAARELLPEVDFGTGEAVRVFVRDLYLPDEVAREPGDEALEQVIRQAFQVRFVLDREADLAPALVRELEARHPAARRETVRTAPRYQLWGLSEELGEASRRAAFTDVVRALELAELAVEVADALDVRLYLPRPLSDRQALARAFLGNARRVASDLFGADRAFHVGLRFLDDGTGADLHRADFSVLLASLRIDQARYSEARRLLEEARRVYEHEEETERVGRVLLQLGLCAGYSGDAREAVGLFARAEELLAASEDERLRLQARHNELLWLVEAGEGLEALARYERARPLYARFADDDTAELRRRWLEGRIHASLGDVETARTALEEVRETAGHRELAYEAAMVSLDLAILHLDRGDLAAVRRLAGELVPVFRSRDLHCHALAALTLFHEAARTESATAALAREVLRYLHRARNNPYLRFELPPAAP